MLSIAAMSGDHASYYLSLAREDYYTKGGEPPGQWFGQGAEALGLSGKVEPRQLYNLFDGRSAEGGRDLVQLQRHEGKQTHRPGWDLTFSAPKSVSVLWSQSDFETRLAIQVAHAKAVQAALSYLEATAGLSRYGSRGSRLEHADLVFALFEHSTSRALDPQLHTHALLMNIGVGVDGKTRTLSSLSVFLAKMAAGTLYRAELARLMQELGYEIVRKRSWFEIVGVLSSLIDEFSKRREAIEASLKEKGSFSPIAAAISALETRDAKESVSREKLFETWRASGRDHGWSEQEATHIKGVPRENLGDQDSRWEARKETLERLTASFAHFTERDFVRFFAEEAQGRGLSAAQILEETQECLSKSPEVIRLGAAAGVLRYTTRETMELEKSLLSQAEELALRPHQELGVGVVMAVLADHPDLSEEQMKAVWHVTVETGGLAIVSGMAGTGKTQMLDVARRAWEESGFQVIGAAIAARAATELADRAEIYARSIARLTYDVERGAIELNPRTVLLIDEAGMVATAQMERLASLCRSSGAKLVLVGDEKQLQPIGPGAPFKELGERHGRAELTDIRRQSQAWARKVAKDMAAGEARQALSDLASRGYVSVADTKAEAIDRLVNKWQEERGPVLESLILAGTRQEAKTLNLRIQQGRQGRGELGANGIEVNGTFLYEGDCVIFKKNSPSRGIDNGLRGVVSIANPVEGTIRVKLTDGRTVTLQVSDYSAIELGYAGTTHIAQGATTRHAYVLAGGSMQDRESSYVQVSRSVDNTWVFATADQVGDELAALAREMERSRQKDMAHTVMRSLQQEL